MHRILCIVLLMFATGCASSKEWDTWISDLKSYNGKSYKVLVRDLGPPDSNEKLSTDERVIVYRHTAIHDGDSYNCKLTVNIDREDTISYFRLFGSPGACKKMLPERIGG